MVRGCQTVRRALIRAAAALAIVACLGGATARADAPDLAAVEARIKDQFPKLEHRPPEAIRERLAGDPSGVVVLDVREAEEFAMSHIAGARRIDPKARPDAVVAAAGDLSGKTVVLYCSVGFRSSKLGTAARDRLLAAGAREVVSLKGGIFAWRNAGLPLQSNGVATDRVHGYNSSWSRFLRQ